MNSMGEVESEGRDLYERELQLKGWKPYPFGGHTYYLIVWDWKDEIPVEEVSYAARKGYTHMHLVTHVNTDDKVIVASRHASFDEQAVYDDYDASAVDE